MWKDALIGLGVAVLAGWLALVGALLLVRPRGNVLREALRILPDLIRLLKNLATDRTQPRAVRIQLGLLMVYLTVPIDLIPDFVPVLGYADDAIIVVAVLRSVVRRVGIDQVRAHWTGTDDGFNALCKAAGLTQGGFRRAE
ncbi:YkvA family protein [Kribbella sp. NPDC056951]|uniref:YkvA family protein n=1 Tax=Kribbella sp. NPDC056951 TaxID=3345978 RepID=UPI003630480E